MVGLTGHASHRVKQAPAPGCGANTRRGARNKDGCKVKPGTVATCVGRPVFSVSPFLAGKRSLDRGVPLAAGLVVVVPCHRGGVLHFAER